MTTIRSHLSFEQFEQVLQKLAHEKAIEAVSDLQDVDLKIHSGKIRDIQTDQVNIRFFTSHISYSEHGKPVKKPDGWRECPKCYVYWTHETRCRQCGEETQPSYMTTYPDSFGFDVEEKLYTTSNHRTKISLLGESAKSDERTKVFIDKIMADQEAKPRFTLSQL